MRPLGGSHSAMRSPLSLTSSSSWLLLVILSTICILSTSFIPLADAQTPSSIRPTSTTPATSTTSTTPQPTAPSPPTLPPGTRELQDSQVVADRVAQGQLQTYHFSIAQQQRLPVRRQLERIIFHPGLDKRQAPLTPTPTPPSTTTTPAAPTRTIAPTVPSPFANGTYAVFISISTCSTPQGGSEGTCPPLVLYVSTSASQPLPGPGQESQGVQMVAGQDGLIQFTAYTTRDLFFSLQPPSLQGYTGDWAVEVGASSQGYVQQYQGSPGLLLDDTDSTSASFLTYNFTAVPTFKVYLVNANTLPQGLTRSLCAIEVVQPVPLSKTTMTVTQTNRTSNLDGSMGTEIIPAEPTFEQFGQRRQVLIQSLTPGTRYTAFFITDVLNQAGAEVMFAMTPFVTKRHDNCVLITDLTFCHEVAYAVPITPMSTLPGDGGAGLSNSTVHQDIKAFYDNFTSNLMDNFNRVIGQYDCTRSQYSLIRNCTDCTRAYRRWLCSASIPRCTDVEDVIDPNNIGYTPPPPPADPSQNVNPYLIDRTKGPVVVERDTASSRGAIAQLSQNPLMNPGQYGEVLPCIDLCFDVVQSCPNFLGFNCPIKNMAGNYAHMNPTGFQCNGLGVVPVPSSGTRLGRSWLGLVATLFLFHLFVVLPTSALAKVSRRAKLFFGIESSGSSSRLNRHQAGSADTDLDESSSTQKMGYRNSTTTSMQDSAANPLEGVGAVGEKFLQQYTLDNHLGSPSSTAMSSNNNNGSMLRRSSRFKSKSDLDEFAQSSTTTTSFAAGILQPSLNTARSSTSTRAISHGYGTDSMAEDGSGDNSATPSRSVAGARLRQRMGRPSSGLGAPGSGSHGGIGARKKTLVLDLDETLIHSTSRGSRSQGYMVEVLVDRHACLYYVYKRPHVDYFLKKVAEWYKLVIFTASMAEYADPVIDWLDQSRTLFDKRYFRQACYFKNGSYLKDLTVIDPDLSSVCLLDNSPISYSLNKENGIPIDSWINDPNDEALLDLLPFLDALRFTEDVRSVLSLRTV